MRCYTDRTDSSYGASLVLNGITGFTATYEYILFAITHRNAGVETKPLREESSAVKSWLCPSVQSSGEAVRDQLTLGGILLAYPFCSICSTWAPTSCGCSGSLLPVVHRRWAPICSIVHTASTDTQHALPAVTVIVRAAWLPKAGNGSKSRHGVSYRSLTTIASSLCRRNSIP